MKKGKAFLLAAIFFCILVPSYPAQAEVIEVLRGEEKETEVNLEGTEEVYSLSGELEGTKDYVTLAEPEEESWYYQAMELEPDGSSAELLLSSLGEDTGSGLRLRLKVQGVRIGTGSVRITSAQMTDAQGNWLEGVELPEITVKVLPNPLEVELSGEPGNGDWYTGIVSVTVKDKDAANIRYELNGEKKEYTGPFTVYDGEWELIVTSDDGYGYKKEETRQIYVDTINPTLSVSAGEIGWQQETIRVVAGSSDNGSGVGRSVWAFSESREIHGTWDELDGRESLTMEEDGVWYLHLRAVDRAGNEKEMVYGPYRKDSAEPQVTIENIGEGQLVEEKITPEIKAVDECSGIKKVTYLLDGKAWNLSEITEKGEHTLTVTAEDLAGNTHTESVTFCIYDKVTVTADAGDCRYSELAGLSARVMYQGEPLAHAEAEFFINGESVGTGQTDRGGRVQIYLPMEMSPQEAELTVVVSQDDVRFFAESQDTCTFAVRPEDAWFVYTGDYSVWNGEALHVHLETGEISDRQMGDITRAELLVELYRVEDDGSRTFEEEVLLNPDEWGIAEHDFYPGTGLYEMKISFTESSCYTAKELILHPAVYDIRASLDWETGYILLDLPHLGIYVEMQLTFLPAPSLEADIQVRIPGTGITLTENRITDYSLTTDGLILYGTAVNPKDRSTYSYEIRTGYTMGIFLDELEASVWKGTDKTKKPVYHFIWDAEEGVTEE